VHPHSAPSHGDQLPPRDFSKPWKNFREKFQGLENVTRDFPRPGKIQVGFSKPWKIFQRGG
jgi:hypothetical protein